MKKLYLLTLSSAVVSLAPCFAQNEIDNNQPVTGPLNKTEARLQSKLTADFNNGFIDEAQLSEFQRDLDGILDHENALLTEGGINESGKKTLLKDLAAFEVRLDKQANMNKLSKGK